MILNGTLGAVIAASYLFVDGLIGMAAGGLVHLFTRQRWGLRAAAADWALAVAAALVFDFVIFLPNNFPSGWINTLDMAGGAAVVVARRLAPLVLRRKGTVGGNRPS